MSVVIIGWVIAAIGVIMAILGFRSALISRRERNYMEQTNAAINSAAQRLQAAREANSAPIDSKLRNEFEKQP